MKRSLRISTFVAKLMIFTVFSASFLLSAAKATDSFKQEDQRILAKVRLSLWYKGLEETKKKEDREAPRPLNREELQVPLQKYFKDMSH